MTVAFKEAVDTGRAILKDAWRDSYTTASRAQGVTEVRCPGCGTVIRKMLPVGPQAITRVKNQTFVSEQMQLVCLANYREVLLEMTNGRHVLCTCDRCALEVHDPMFATALYAASLAEMSAEGARLSDAMCNRGPVGVLKIADTISE